MAKGNPLAPHNFSRCGFELSLNDVVVVVVVVVTMMMMLTKQTELQFTEKYDAFFTFKK